ncbi:hypothetical protein [Agrobacterium pusense]|uniref:hypothetical protein n=1 Tax=Agrobacterium pusense TaxID=648995 RepID=UPI0032DB7048
MPPCEPGWRRHRDRHPLGISGARLVLTASLELEQRYPRQKLATMCIRGRTTHIALLTRLRNPWYKSMFTSA